MSSIDWTLRRAVAALSLGLMSAMGGTLMAGSLGGFAFPLFAGVLLDRMGAAGYAVLFGICGSAYLLAFFANHLLAPRFESITLPSRH